MVVPLSRIQPDIRDSIRKQLPAAADIPTAIDTICLVVDGIREGTFRVVCGIGFFTAKLARVWIAALASVVVVVVIVVAIVVAIVVVGSVGGCILLLEVGWFGDHGDILWRRRNFETFSSVVLMAPAVHLFDDGVDFLQIFR